LAQQFKNYILVVFSPLSRLAFAFQLKHVFGLSTKINEVKFCLVFLVVLLSYNGIPLE